MPETVTTVITLGDSTELTLEDAARIALDEAQGDAYDTRNGLQSQHPQEVTRSVLSETPTDTIETVTLQGSLELTLEDLSRLTLADAQGRHYDTRNGLRSRRPTEVSR